MIRLESVYFGYGSTEVFAGLSLRIAEGEFVAVTGPSGSGKTTLLHLISGLERAQAGRVIVGDVDLSWVSSTGLNEFRRNAVSIVYQSFNLIPYLTTLENVTLPLYLRGLSPTEQRRRARETLERVGLGHRSGHLPRQLSMGECQRVAIARSLVTRAPILLADEPTGNLDDENTLGLMTLFVELHQHERRTIILATHDARAACYASRRLELGKRTITTCQEERNGIC